MDSPANAPVASNVPATTDSTIPETKEDVSSKPVEKAGSQAKDSAPAHKQTKQTTAPKKLPQKTGKSQKILETAYTQIGKLYRYGGSSPKTGFDCSGFTRWVFAQHGIRLPRSSGEQLHAGKSVKRKDLRPGDLLIYSRRIGRRRGTHVGIYVGNGKFIHSPRTGHRIQVSDAFDSYRTKRFIAARRVLEDPNAAPLPASEQEYLAQKALERNKPKYEPPKLHENTFAESYKIYHVRRGDTISGLAGRFHVPMRQLLAANQLGKRDVLQLGQRLMIPQRVPAGKIVKPGERRPEVGNVAKHKIARGDTLGALAHKYGVSSDAIAKANKLRSKHAIREGQVLLIPTTQASSSQNAPQQAETKAAQVEEDILVAEVVRPEAKKDATPKKKRSAPPKREPQKALESVAAAVEEDILVPAPAPRASYTVKSGDTIWSISKKFGLSEQALLVANKLNKKHTLQLGQKLVIPGKHAGQPKKAEKSTPHTTAGKMYVVKSGDTIWKIAKRHGLSEKQLLSANKLSKKHVLRPGQKLVIP